MATIDLEVGNVVFIPHWGCIGEIIEISQNTAECRPTYIVKFEVQEIDGLEEVIQGFTRNQLRACPEF